ncbi:TPA: type II toxin-antitoxin system VapC family toxin [Candidatus Poribacteria bacterium]|nr:type II toxin-antitoxin system VapC family toxin [Candidatus Poribacteria bacterium]
MRFLIDTNIFIEIILEQERSSEARDLLSKVHEYDFFISDLSFHSIGFLLFRRKMHHSFEQFSKDMIQDAGTIILSLSIEDLNEIISSAFEFNLDFDDAYQYAISEKYDLTIVSFDSDFDRTHRGRKTPQNIINEKETPKQ